MRQWSILLGGLLVWAAHFFALYLFASVFPGSDLARWLTIAATVPALGIDGTIVWLGFRTHASDGESWFRRTGAIGAALSGIAVIWQALPAVVV